LGINNHCSKFTLYRASRDVVGGIVLDILCKKKKKKKKDAKLVRDALICYSKKMAFFDIIF
jgi:hypothetical protein